MKKKKISSLIWASLTALSIFCYTYLHVASVEKYGTCPSSVTSVEQEDEALRKSTIVLPDVALIKKILNITKIVMPTN